MRIAAIVAFVLLAGCAGKAAVTYQGVVECDEETLSSEVTARVAVLKVDEGQRVEAGAVLLQLDTEALRLAAAEADAQVALANAELALVRAGSRPEEIAAARASAEAAATARDVAQAEQARIEDLYTRKLSSDQDRDRARDAAAQAAGAASAALERLKQLFVGARAEDIAVATARLNAAQATAARAAERLARSELRSPGVRVVRHTHLHPGELAQPGVPAITLVDLDHPYVDAFVAQADLAALHVGQTATVRVDGGPPRTGTIERIGERLEFTPRFLFGPSDRPNLVARVRVRLPSGAGLNAGVPADVAFQP